MACAYVYMRVYNDNINKNKPAKQSRNFLKNNFFGRGTEHGQ